MYPFDFPDPAVILVGQTYYAYATNSVAGNIQIVQSTDRTHWTVVGSALPSLPAWAQSHYTWAPAVAMIGASFVLYYAANVAGGGKECISVATATRPQGPFVDRSTAPLECQRALGGSIDPASFVDPNGRLYLLWKSGGPGASKIWSEQLNETGTAFAPGATPTVLLTPGQPWEAGTVEAPDLVAAGGRYLLFFSGNNWEGAHYAVGVATCSGPLGTCTDSSTSPILSSGPGVAGPGASRCSPTRRVRTGSPSTAGCPGPSASRTAETSTSSRSPSRAPRRWSARRVHSSRRGGTSSARRRPGPPPAGSRPGASISAQIRANGSSARSSAAPRTGQQRAVDPQRGQLLEQRGVGPSLLQRAASLGAPRTVTSQSAGSSGMSSMWRQRANTAAADFAPQPASPGNPSALSPTSAR